MMPLLIIILAPLLVNKRGIFLVFIETVGALSQLRYLLKFQKYLNKIEDRFPVLVQQTV